VAHGEEYRVLEAIVTEKILVEEQNPNVGGVPGGDQSYGEETAPTLHSVTERAWI